jgi:hypothetical protein
MEEIPFSIIVENLAPILSAFLQNPIGLIAFISTLISIIAFFFFNKEHVVFRFFVLLLLGFGSGGAVYATMQVIRPGVQQTVVESSVRHDEPSASLEAQEGSRGGRLPVDAQFGFLPSETNIIVFDASSAGGSGKRLAEEIVKSSLVSSVDFLNDWLDRWVMDVTRIYFIGEENRLLAEQINRALPGVQFVIDYNNQSALDHPEYWPESPNRVGYRMVGFNSDRDIAIFAADDISFN